VTSFLPGPGRTARSFFFLSRTSTFGPFSFRSSAVFSVADLGAGGCFFCAVFPFCAPPPLVQLAFFEEPLLLSHPHASTHLLQLLPVTTPSEPCALFFRCASLLIFFFCLVILFFDFRETGFSHAAKSPSDLSPFRGRNPPFFVRS